MEMRVAIWFRSASSATWAMAYVRNMARIGSSFLCVPLPNTDRPGSSLSRARAWNSLAEPMMPIKAEKKVTAHSPARMTGGDMLVRERTFAFARKDSWVVLAAMERTTTK